MKNYIKKISLIFASVAALVAVFCGVFLLKPETQNIELKIEVFSTTNGAEITPNLTNGGNIQILENTEVLTPISTTENTLIFSLNPSKSYTFSASPATGFGFAGAYTTPEFGIDNLITNSAEFSLNETLNSTLNSTTENQTIFAKFGKLESLTLSVQTSTNTTKEIVADFPLSIDLSEAELMPILQENLTPASLSAYQQPNQTLAFFNESGAVKNFNFTKQNSLVNLAPSAIDSVGTAYTVTFNANGGSVSPTTTSVTINSVSFYLSGFSGSSGNSGTASGSWSSTTSTATYERYWYCNSVGNGGNGPYVYPSIDLTVGTNYIVTFDLRTTKAISFGSLGHEQGGYTSYNCTTSYTNFKHGFTATDRAERAIVFYANTGQWTSGTYLYVKNIYIYTTQKYTTLPTPTRTGYTFAGWYKESSFTNQVTTSTVCDTIANHTLYAKWTANTYTIKYNGNGATSGSIASSSHTYGTAKALTANGFSRTNYTFLGWSTSSTATTATYTNSQSVSNLTSTNGGTVNLYAVWAANYTVAYNGNGATSGSTASSSHVWGTAKALTSNGFAKTGYTFQGWNTSASATSVTYTNGQSVSNLTTTGGATVTLYAVWKANTYTVVYNANGGLGSMSNSSHTYDTEKTLTANAFTKQGYIFLGWSTNQNANSATYTNQQSVKNLTTTANGTVTLYAVWGYVYTVEYNGNGATSGSTATSVHTLNMPSNLTANGYVKTGYTFLGWSRSSAATTATYTNGQEVNNLANSQYATVMLYAVWQGINYSVHYDANGGSGSMENSSHVYGTPSELRPNTFVREGYIFLGWSKNNNAQIQTYNEKQMVWLLTTEANATVTLYAIWLKKDITVTVDPNGGVYNGVETATVYNCSVGSDLVLGVPSRPGYEFTEFNTQGDGLGQTLNGTMVLNGDVTFYALWQPLNYVIKYYDGDLYLGQTEAWYNENLSLPRWETLLSNNSLNGGKFKQYGWNFAGWTTDQNGAQIQHSNGGAVLNLTEAGTTINLYAMHTQTLNLTYNGNGSISGNVAKQSTDILLNSKSEKITDFVIKLANNSYAKTNYSFKNWAIGSTSGSQYSEGSKVTNVDLNLTYLSTFNKTIYAIWQGNSYTINYYNGTSKISTGNYVFGNSATLKIFSTIGEVLNLAYGWEFYGWATAINTFTRVFEDGENITNISVENGAEITQNMVINLYSIYSRDVSFVSGLNKASTTTATQFWNPYSTNTSNLSSVLAEAPQIIETGNWIALGYRTDLTASTATFALTTTTEIRPAVNTFNTLYAVYSRTITIADLNTTTTATQYYNSVGIVSTI